MDLDERIKLFEEILEQDPSSKLFFQLAKLYLEKNEIDKSISILKMGLDKHPEHMEARLLLIDLLTKNNMDNEANLHIEKIHSILTKYTSFWKKWADLLSNNKNYDLALLIFILSIVFKNGNLSNISEFLYKYLTGQNLLIFNKETPSKEKSRDEMKPKIEEGEEKSQTVIKARTSEEIEFKTKTMADILMAQGDYKGAISIFKELLEKETDETKIAELKKCINEAEKKLFAAPAARSQIEPKHRANKRKLLTTLKKLATRLEARAI